MKEKKNNNLFLLAAVCFYVSALLGFINNSHTLGVMHLTLGSVFLCIYATRLNQTDSEEEKEGNQAEEGNQVEEDTQVDE